MQKSQKNDKKMPKKSGNGKEGEEEMATSRSNEASINNVLESLSQLSKELKDFKQDMRKDLSEFKSDVTKSMKDDLAEFKAEVLSELQSQNASITEAQTRIADLESVCLELKDTLITVVKQSTEMRDKIIDLESRSRRNNLRIYGIPEGKEGKSVAHFVSELLKKHLGLPPGVELQIQRAHRALIPKPTATATPRSIIVNFLQFQVKELVLQKAWQTKFEIDRQPIYFDSDYATDIVKKRKAYGPIKTILKEKGIRFQTPYTRMRVHWETGLQIYGSAEEAAEDLNRRGYQVTVEKTNTATVVEERLNELLPWKNTTSDRAAQRARERLTEFRRDHD